FDCVFSPGSIPVAYLKTSLPKVMYMDATFDCMLDYYEPSSDLSSDIIRQGHELEKQALDSCALAIFSSDWAAQSAINYYGTSPSKVKVVPFGANFDVVNSEPQVKDIINIRDKHTLKILFNGVDWLRKGGDVVLSTVDELIKRGLQVELHVAGLHSIPISNIPHFVINHGYLKKGIPEEKEALENLYNTCHFLFLPSRAEAFGCVFCEASLFGMPSISRKTGGVPTSIINGKNGFALDQSAGVNDYADLICDLFLDKDKYTALAESSYEEYKNRLNWKTAGESLTQLMEQL
ncbi:MAG: glycosyltransferase family 4 protein, partial [Chitinophagaceae bacterium]